MMLEVLKLTKISFVQNVTLIDKFVFRMIAYSNYVNNIVPIYYKLNNMNVTTLLPKFNGIFKTGINTFVSKFNPCNIV